MLAQGPDHVRDLVGQVPVEWVVGGMVNQELEQELVRQGPALLPRVGEQEHVSLGLSIQFQELRRLHPHRSGGRRR